MRFSCAHCGAPPNYMTDGFDRAQCLQCGGVTDYQGRASVPTSALEANATWDGPGKELIPDQAHPEVTQSTDTGVQLAQKSPPRRRVKAVTPAGQEVEVEVADEGVFPAGQVTGDQPSQVPGTVPPAPET